jgi:hypothetical protein
VDDGSEMNALLGWITQGFLKGAVQARGVRQIEGRGADLTQGFVPCIGSNTGLGPMEGLQ